MLVTAFRVKRFMLSVIYTAIFKQSREKNKNIKYTDFLPYPYYYYIIRRSLIENP